jgi:small subunit ribosomal protein S15
MSEVTAPSLNTFQLHEKDTGSSDVQIALLTGRINYLTQHLTKHSKDHSTRRGLLKMVARRRKLLDYLKVTAEDRYTKAVKTLRLRR